MELSLSGINIRIVETNSRLMTMKPVADNSGEVVDCYNRFARLFRSSMRTICSVPENPDEASLAILAMVEGNCNPPFTSPT